MTVADAGCSRRLRVLSNTIYPTKDEVRGLVTANPITRAVVRNFPDAKVMPFGSFEMKLYLPSG